MLNMVILPHTAQATQPMGHTILTSRQARAVTERGALFTSDLPEIYADYDDGDDDYGRVILLGLSEARGYVRVRKPKTSDVYVVPLRCITLDAETAAHLDQAAEWIEARDAANASGRRLISGSYSDGKRHLNFRGRRR